MNEKQYIKARKKASRLEVPNHPEPPQIVSNIPVPEETRGGSRHHTHYYPFEEMKPGDSFWVPANSHCTLGAVTKFAKKSGWKFVTRAQGICGKKNGELCGKTLDLRGTRVWRTS